MSAFTVLGERQVSWESLILSLKLIHDAMLMVMAVS